VVALGLDQRILLPRWINELGFQMCSPPGARRFAYIVLSNEYGPSDQTDINRTVFLDPLGRWSMIRDIGSDWPSGQGGRPRGRAGALPSGPFSLPFVLVASGLF